MIYVRFYGELKKYNDYIEYLIIKKEKGITIYDIIKSKKIPLKDISLILLNSESVYPDIEIDDNDLISFYPEFRNIDISPIKLLNLSNLIDTHSHLDEYNDPILILNSAKEFGVEKIIAVSTHFESSKKLLELSKLKFPVDLYLSFGVHPNNLNTDIENGIDIIIKNIEKIIAIGECGLDYKYKGYNKRLQEEVFIRQIDISKEYNKPIIVHSRASWNDCFKILYEHGVETANFHWYSGDLGILKKILDKGFFISATPSIKNSPNHRDAIKYAPIENILIETDSPVKHFKKESEPKDIIITIKYLSELKKLPYDTMIEITNVNARKFFQI